MNPSPRELWLQAKDEHPEDTEAARERYRALMGEHGYMRNEEGYFVTKKSGGE